MGAKILFIYVHDFSLRRVRVMVNDLSRHELAPAATATRLEIEKISSFYGGTNNGFLPAIFSSNRLLLPPAPHFSSFIVLLPNDIGRAVVHYLEECYRCTTVQNRYLQYAIDLRLI